MHVYLTIARYPKWLAWVGFLSMAIFHLTLSANKKISFYKLLGCGKNGTFSKMPDWRQWGILSVTDIANEPKLADESALTAGLYGHFIAAWWRFFKCTKWTVVLEPIEGHGKWDGKDVFGQLPGTSEYAGPIAVLTRATIRLPKLSDFWRHADAISKQLSNAEGLLTTLGIGEVPWIKQATFSIWKNKESMKAFAYKMKEHTEVIRKTRQESWYSEEMFVRFKIIASEGSIPGSYPLQGKG